MLPRPMRAGFRPAVQPRRVSRAVATGGPQSFSTEFTADENPYSEGGQFTSINTTLTQTRSTSGHVYAAFDGDMTLYQDSYALKTGTWADDQEAEAVVYRAGGYNPTNNHEIEILLRGSETTTTRTWYECLWDKDGNMSFVYLTGPADGFTDMGNDYFAGVLVPVDGMVARGKVTGQGASTLLQFYVNDVLRLERTVTNSAQWITGGRPGYAFFTRADTVSADLGWKSWSCTDL